MLNVAFFLFCLVRYTLDEFGTARRCAVVRGFIDALTRGGPGGTPRPIEMHSHDPMRYLSNPICELNIVINCMLIGEFSIAWLNERMPAGSKRSSP